jgi:glutamine synthetase
MPKPIEGSGAARCTCTCRCSRATPTPSTTRRPLPPVADGAAFTAGLLRHAREITAVTNQWVNSYKRLTARLHGPLPSGEAPVFVTWGHSNRSALIRVPMYKPRKGASTRIEYRAPDPACNPYLAFALLLAAGAQGHRGGLRAARRVEDNAFELTDAERARRASSGCPRASARR